MIKQNTNITMKVCLTLLVISAFFHNRPVRADDTISDEPATPKENFLAKATDEYLHRQYADAAHDLGAALPSEFNNPLLHYYFANCMVHLHRKESAIREYRIAYALQPNGTVGDYCKLCLDRFGIDAEGKKLSEPKAPQNALPKKPSPNVPEPPSAAELAALKANPKDGSQNAIEREKSVTNLRDLMQQKRRPNGAPLPNDVGTNLYVRNYKETAQAKTALAQAPAQTNSSATTKNELVKTAPTKQQEQPRKFKLWWW